MEKIDYYSRKKRYDEVDAELLNELLWLKHSRFGSEMNVAEMCRSIEMNCDILHNKPKHIFYRNVIACRDNMLIDIIADVYGLHEVTYNKGGRDINVCVGNNVVDKRTLPEYTTTKHAQAFSHKNYYIRASLKRLEKSGYVCLLNKIKGITQKYKVI